MDESKFINSQTIDFLKARQKSTYQQQIDTLKERVTQESNALNDMISNQVKDRVHSSQNFQDYHELLVGLKENFRDQIKELNSRLIESTIIINQNLNNLNRRLNRTLLVGGLLTIGVLAWLIKLSI